LSPFESLSLGKWQTEKGYEEVENRYLLCVTGNVLKILLPELAKPSNPRKLDLSNNPLEACLNWLPRLANLEELILIRAELQETPDSLLNLDLQPSGAWQLSPPG